MPIQPKKKTKKKFDIEDATKDMFMMMGDVPPLYYLNGKLIHKGKILTEDEKKSIINEAQLLLQIGLFEQLLQDMEHVACKKIYMEGAGDPEVLKGGKWILYAVDVLRKKVKNLSKLK